LSRVSSERKEHLAESTWFSANGFRLRNERIAYFSMEFGLSEAIPLYAGGLGILAGDYLKTASDLGMPVVGVGILFQEGYFRQIVDAAGRQHEAYPYNDPTTLPIEPVAGPHGGWLRVGVDLPGRTLWLRVWRANVGRVDLYLLDSNDLLNTPVDRGITSKLYGGGPETRLLQEIVLGIGGWRALSALGLEPTIAHLNEGHAAFVVIERARRFMEQAGVSFYEALWATRAGNVFTTHTPVVAGFDVFAPELIDKYLPPFGAYLGQLGISTSELFALGRRDPSDGSAPFNMAHLAMRGCSHTNAVSRLHGTVSRRLFAELFPRWPEREVPVDHVTNGVHVPSWDSRASDSLWSDACGKERWRGSIERLPSVITSLSDEDLWKMRSEERSDLLSYARRRLQRQFAQRGAQPSVVESAPRIFEPGALTIGLARRFAEYKRSDLLLHEPDRLARLLSDAARPVQLVVAGKAHPDDELGKHMIAEWIAFVNRPEVRHRAAFIEDYDMSLAEQLVQGVDVWINTPRRPWEACGTSGMKVLVNGGLNLSELDGWWAEAYTPEVGWALGEHDGITSDSRDAEDLYAALEQRVVPEFYDRDDHGIPRRWLARIRASMAALAPTFSSNRMVLEYAERVYVGAAERFHERVENGARLARELRAWQQTLEAHWSELRVGERQIAAREGALEFKVSVDLGSIPPEAVCVELFADTIGDEPPFCCAMEPVRDASGGRRLFAATVATSRPASDFTARVVPDHPGVRVPAEIALIHWGP
ncbi:MAG TPA: alpha-glucan family phosphorylase, partial [Polyangiaceae bacterium]|nr:alpha-glucan family phosphorylase [Polyangiaceae bacterium]